MLSHMFEAPTGKTTSITITRKDVENYIKTNLSKELQTKVLNNKKPKKAA